MENIDELYTKAKEKLEAESFQHGTPQDVIRGICLEWLEWAVANDAKAVELMADDDKNTKGAYVFMENFARNYGFMDNLAHNKKGRTDCKKGRTGCVKLEPLEAMTCIMEYYGINKNTAHQQLESGLMYHLMMAECRKYKPYSADEQVTATATTTAATSSSAPEAAKATPVTDLQEAEPPAKPAEYEKPKIEAAPTPFSFDDFDSELEGLL